LNRTEPGIGRAAWMALFFAGLSISVVMVVRSQVETDQFQLLIRGWLLARHDVLVPYGNLTSAGGYEPGPMTSLVVGLPMKIVMDHRAPTVLILLSHVAAFLILDRIVARTLGGRARLLLMVFYWLAPWRIFFSGMLWNPNFLFIAGAVHLWACLAQRERGRPLHSFVMVATVGLLAQVHPSAIILVAAAVLLWLRGYWKPHWIGAVAGAALTAVSFVPWYLVAQQHADILPAKEGFLFRSAVLVYPVIKGALYWLRYPSLWCSTKWMTSFDFTPAFGVAADVVLTPFYRFVVWTAGPLSAVVTVLAARWAWGRGWLRRRIGRGDLRSDRVWLHGYVAWVFAGSIFTFGLSPVGVMMWQGVVALHAASLAVVLWGSLALRAWRPVFARRAVAAYVALSLVVALGLTFGSGIYRRGGRPSVRGQTISFSAANELDRDLRLSELCGIPVGPRENAIDVDGMAASFHPFTWGMAAGSAPRRLDTPR
jgi:hypothetical protein